MVVSMRRSGRPLPCENCRGDLPGRPPVTRYNENDSTLVLYLKGINRELPQKLVRRRRTQ